MKKIYSLLMLTVFVLCSCSSDDDDEKVLQVSFDGLLTESETEYVGPKEGTLPEGVYYYESTFTDPTGFFTFTHYVPASGTQFGGGFTYTNKTDKETASFMNTSAITGRGQSGSTYLTSNFDTYSRKAVITLKESHVVRGAYFTNSTYAYLSMLNGDTYAKKFTDTDWFKLTITGKLKGTETTSVDFYLAKDGKIVNTWTWVDLTSLGNVDELNFSFESTDNGQWGINTPTYFCMDDLSIIL